MSDRPVESPRPRPDYTVLFQEGQLSLTPEQRRELALGYMDRFSHKVVDGQLLREAGINLQTTDPRQLEVARIQGSNLALTALMTRLNYCQYLLKPEEQPILPFTELRLSSNMNPKDIEGIHLPPNEEIRVVSEPLYANSRENIVRQYTEDDKRSIVGAYQMQNQGARLIGEKHKMPSSETVAVLYFKHNPTAEQSQ